MDTKTIQRRFDLDWLRVLAILSVFVYHSTLFFSLEDWHVKNAVTYASVQAFGGFLQIWMMPMVFLISGASIFYAMDKGGAGTFFKDKALRLFVPLLVAVFTYASLQVYLERVTHGQFSGSYFAFLPRYIEGLYVDIGSEGNFAFHGMHMWYVLILFLYCLIFYPLFRWWKGSGRGALDKLGGLLSCPWILWLALAFPILLLSLAIQGTDLEFGAGGWGFLYYIFFLLYGFVIVSHERLQANIKRMRWFHLILGLVFGVARVFIVANVASPAVQPFEGTLSSLLCVLSACNLLPAFLGFGMQHLTFTTPFLKYAGQAVMGFYILHQTILLVIGYFVVQWAVPDLGKWAIIFACSFVVIMAIYEFVVRRFNTVRFLFGMKMLASPARSQTEKSETQGAARARRRHGHASP